MLLAGSLVLSVWRVWLRPRCGSVRRRGQAAALAPPRRTTPRRRSWSASCTTRPCHARAGGPSWLVIPETGLYTGVLIVGAVGSGKTSACMYPFAEQLLSWQAGRPERRAGALVLEVKGDFCHKYSQMIAHIVRCRPVTSRNTCNYSAIQSIRSGSTASLLC